LTLLLNVVGLAIITFASLKVSDPALQAKLLEIGQWLMAFTTGSYVISRGVSKIGQPTSAAQAAAEVAKT